MGKKKYSRKKEDESRFEMIISNDLIDVICEKSKKLWGKVDKPGYIRYLILQHKDD